MTPDLAPDLAPGHAADPAPDLARAARDARHAAWLAEATGGRAEAFERFYDESFASARALARRMLRGPAQDADCEDLLADAYFEAWRKLAQFDASRGSALTWLLQIVRSRALDQLRRRATQPEQLADDEATDALPDESALADPAGSFWRLQASQRLHGALLTLSAAERWVLGLAYFRELSHSEIAAATGLPLGTVKSHLLRAQTRLRGTLAEP
jgi:RNA polymerase sigma-70 factor, ECF subfamily